MACPNILGKTEACVKDADGNVIAYVNIAESYDPETLAPTETKLYELGATTEYTLPAGATLSRCCCDSASGAATNYTDQCGDALPLDASLYTKGSIPIGIATVNNGSTVRLGSIPEIVNYVGGSGRTEVTSMGRRTLTFANPYCDEPFRGAIQVQSGRISMGQDPNTQVGNSLDVRAAIQLSGASAGGTVLWDSDLIQTTWGDSQVFEWFTGWREFTIAPGGTLTAESFFTVNGGGNATPPTYGVFNLPGMIIIGGLG